MKIEVVYRMCNGNVVTKRFSRVRAVIEDRGVAVSRLELHYQNGEAAEVLCAPVGLTWEQWGLEVHVVSVRDKK